MEGVVVAIGVVAEQCHVRSVGIGRDQAVLQRDGGRDVDQQRPAVLWRKSGDGVRVAAYMDLDGRAIASEHRGV